MKFAVDDIEKTQDTWEELIIDAYNNTAQGTRSYSVENFPLFQFFQLTGGSPVENEGHSLAASQSHL